MSIPKREDQYSSTLHNRGGARAGSGPKPKPIEDRIKPKLLGLSSNNISKIEGYVERLASKQKVSQAKIVRIAIDLLRMSELRRALK